MDATKLGSEAEDDKRAIVIGSVAFCISFPAVLVALRIYTRTAVMTLFGIDDILAIGAIVSVFGVATEVDPEAVWADV